jgi:putative Mg2+ transporter-C (MgtC) family protein
MPLHVAPEQIALRLGLACIAGFIIGLNRDEHGHPAGTRTTMLVCLAAALSMVEVNLLVDTSGKTPNSFVQLDMMRLPLGILSGIGFIGAGVIIKQDKKVSGVTTAATIWLVTVLGLLFGAGSIALGVVGSLLAFVILWAMKFIEHLLPHQYSGSLHLALSPDAPSEADLRAQLCAEGRSISQWSVSYDADMPVEIQCETRWTSRSKHIPGVPSFVQQLRTLQGVRVLAWKE